MMEIIHMTAKHLKVLNHNIDCKAAITRRWATHWIIKLQISERALMKFNECKDLFKNWSQSIINTWQNWWSFLFFIFYQNEFDFFYDRAVFNTSSWVSVKNWTVFWKFKVCNVCIIIDWNAMTATSKSVDSKEHCIRFDDCLSIMIWA